MQLESYASDWILNFYANFYVCKEKKKKKNRIRKEIRLTEPKIPKRALSFVHFVLSVKNSSWRVRIHHL